jgi:hypothetical protein
LLSDVEMAHSFTDTPVELPFIDYTRTLLAQPVIS